jgi:hypothetical protein
MSSLERSTALELFTRRYALATSTGMGLYFEGSDTLDGYEDEEENGG